MKSNARRTLSVAAVSGLLIAGGSGSAFAADASQAHERHRPNQNMMTNPSDMVGMMNAPPMHGAEHPGPDNPPDVVEAVQNR